MPPSLRVDVGRPLTEPERGDLETRLARRLGLVTCVRHPPAIDDVSVARTEKAATVVVAACCELSARRAKALVEEAIKDLPEEL
jgi:hypothetical protein